MRRESVYTEVNLCHFARVHIWKLIDCIKDPDRVALSLSEKFFSEHIRV